MGGREEAMGGREVEFRGEDPFFVGASLPLGMGAVTFNGHLRKEYEWTDEMSPITGLMK